MQCTCSLQVHQYVSDLPLGVAEDDGLRDGQSVVQITQSVKLPLLPLHCHKELLYPLQSELITWGGGDDRQAQRRERDLVLNNRITVAIRLLDSGSEEVFFSVFSRCFISQKILTKHSE